METVNSENSTRPYGSEMMCCCWGTESSNGDIVDITNFPVDQWEPGIGITAVAGRDWVHFGSNFSHLVAVHVRFGRAEIRQIIPTRSSQIGTVSLMATKGAQPKFWTTLQDTVGEFEVDGLGRISPETIEIIGRAVKNSTLLNLRGILWSPIIPQSQECVSLCTMFQLENIISMQAADPQRIRSQIIFDKNRTITPRVAKPSAGPRPVIAA